jgi:hypothetical protein
MARFRRVLVAALGALSVAGATAVGVSAHEGGGTLIEFESMTGVSGAAVGVVNDRGIKGGGLPWVIRSGHGEVDRQGNVKVTVRGLIIAGHTPPNPVPFFKATVSCLTPTGVVNVSTAVSPATPTGNSTIRGKVALPQSCREPIVFVAAPTGQWFAMSRLEEED